MNNNDKYLKLTEKTQSVLKTLCSNYRENVRVKATFKCSIYYGMNKFIKDITKNLKELKKAKLIIGFEILDQETDEENDLCIFNVYATMNMTIEDMANIAVNSQTIFREN